MSDQFEEQLSPWWVRSVLITMAAGFAVLIFLTAKVYEDAPPIPERVISQEGRVVFTGDDIRAGQAVFLKHGLMDNGSIWGHGGYLGPDYSAEYLHNVALTLSNEIARRRFGRSFANLPEPEQAAVSAEAGALLKEILYFGGGLIGTGHHWYWTGQTELNMALSATFSALEVVPLTLLTLDAWDFIKLTRADEVATPNAIAGQKYRWTFYFLMAVGFWNFVGAGIFGFLINLPIVSYFEVGTMLTPNHGHAALMGVFGMLAIALMTLVARHVTSDAPNGRRWRSSPDDAWWVPSRPPSRIPRHGRESQPGTQLERLAPVVASYMFCQFPYK